MSEEPDKEDRTEDPSERKIKKSKEDGQVARSKDFTNFLGMISLLIFALFIFSQVFNNMSASAHKHFVNIDSRASMPRLFSQIGEMFWDVFLNIGLVLIIPTIFAVAGNLLIGGWIFATKRIEPKASNINPISGLKQMFGKESLVEFLKSLIIVVAMGSSLFALFSYSPDFLKIHYTELEQQLVQLAGNFMLIIIAAIFTMLFVAGIDIPFQIISAKDKLKMTLKEVKDENKETQGNPEIKGKLKQLQRQRANARMMSEIPNADIVITNPDHYAVCLKYKKDSMAAPVVVAMGIDLVAFKIKDIAYEHKLVVLQSPKLARTLYFHSEIDQVIPAELFPAVARVFGFIRTLTKLQKKNQNLVYTDVDIPKGMRDR